MSDTRDEARYGELVEQLYEPRTRWAARQKLVAANAVGPLLKCLDSINESVVWAAVESLGQLRAREAVGPLIELLERGVLTVDVCEALTRITGQDFGANVGKWRRWISQAGRAEPPKRDIAGCIRQTGQLLGVEPTGSGESFRFKLLLPDGRTQKVAVYFGREDDRGNELVVIYSECGPVEPKYYQAVLRKNLSIPAGAFAIRDIDGKPNFVMVDAMVADIVTPSALAKKVENIAVRADTVEKVLTKEDRR